MEYEKFDRKEFAAEADRRRQVIELDLKLTLMICGFSLTFGMFLAIIFSPIAGAFFLAMVFMTLAFSPNTNLKFCKIKSKFDACPACYVELPDATSTLEEVTASNACPHCREIILADNIADPPPPYTKKELKDELSVLLGPDALRGVIFFIATFSLGYVILLGYISLESPKYGLWLMIGGYLAILLLYAILTQIFYALQYRRRKGPECPNCHVGLRSGNLRDIACKTGGCGVCGVKLVNDFIPPPPPKPRKEASEEQIRKNTKILRSILISLFIIGILLLIGGLIYHLPKNFIAGTVCGLALVGEFILISFLPSPKKLTEEEKLAARKKYWESYWNGTLKKRFTSGSFPLAVTLIIYVILQFLMILFLRLVLPYLEISDHAPLVIAMTYLFTFSPSAIPLGELLNYIRAKLIRKFIYKHKEE